MGFVCCHRKMFSSWRIENECADSSELEMKIVVWECWECGTTMTLAVPAKRETLERIE